MKKVYLMALAFAVSVGAFAQTSTRVALNKIKPKTSVTRTRGAANRNGGEGNNSIQAVDAVLYSLNNYVAGTTMDLNFILELYNTDSEYGDSLAITFPSGFTINSVSPNDSIGVAEAPDPAASGCPDLNSGTKEPFDGIFGQTIAWGNDDNCYGGISTTAFGGSFLITVNVTIDPSTTGDLLGDVFVSGDGFGAAPADFNGNFLLQEQLANDANSLGSLLLFNQNVDAACGLTTDYLATIFINNGTNPITVPASASYSVNGGPFVNETVATYYTLDGNPASVINPGDTGAVIFLASPIDLSLPGTYDIVAVLNTTGDGRASNDTSLVSITNIASSSVALGSPYLENFGTSTAAGTPLPLGWTTADVDLSGLTFGIAGTGAGAGACIRAFEGNVPTASDDWAFSKCVDLTAGQLYKFSMFQRANTPGATPYSTVSESQVSYGFFPAVDSMIADVIALDTVTANGRYALNANDFTVPVTGTYYFGIRATNPDPAQTIALRVDNVKIELLGTVGTKEVAATKAISVFPNPSNGVFNVNTNEKVNTIAVFNVVGELVYNNDKNLSTNNTIDISNLTSGIYFVKVYTNSGVTTQQINIVK